MKSLKLYIHGDEIFRAIIKRVKVNNIITSSINNSTGRKVIKSPRNQMLCALSSQ